VRLLFIKHSLNWPRTRGHDVLAYFLMKALAVKGHELNLLTVERPQPAALSGLPVVSTVASAVEARAGTDEPHLGRLRDRFCSYWGVDREELRAAITVVHQWNPDAVIAVGPEVLPYLAAIPRRRRIWYAADDLCLQHLTQVRGWDATSRTNLRTAVVTGLYERAFASAIDRVWVVSAIDARAVRLFGGARHVDIIPNGVDTEYFRPVAQVERPDSAMFWGNLEFAPNVEAINWFCSAVWPHLRRRRPGATLTLAGYAPSADIRSLSGQHGIRVVGEIADLRGEVARHQVALMPFRSGSGSKTKMLEAAAMGRSTVCSRLALNGLRGEADQAFLVADRPAQWVSQLEALWDNDGQRAALGAGARRWVEANHTWGRSADLALESLQC
jgi:glycosyltransferase involved in cell wall biosynthesis